MAVLGDALVRKNWDAKPALPDDLRKLAETTANNRNSANFFLCVYNAINKAYKEGHKDGKANKRRKKKRQE